MTRTPHDDAGRPSPSRGRPAGVAAGQGQIHIAGSM